MTKTQLAIGAGGYAVEDGTDRMLMESDLGRRVEERLKDLFDRTHAVVEQIATPIELIEAVRERRMLLQVAGSAHRLQSRVKLDAEGSFGRAGLYDRHGKQPYGDGRGGEMHAPAQRTGI